MTAEALPAWNVFKQIFAEHWDGFKRVYPRYDTRYYAGSWTRCSDAGSLTRWAILSTGVCSAERAFIASP
jgi:hypothetical protein